MMTVSWYLIRRLFPLPPASWHPTPPPSQTLLQLKPFWLQMLRLTMSGRCSTLHCRLVRSPINRVAFHSYLTAGKFKCCLQEEASDSCKGGKWPQGGGGGAPVPAGPRPVDRGEGQLVQEGCGHQGCPHAGARTRWLVYLACTNLDGAGCRQLLRRAGPGAEHHDQECPKGKADGDVPDNQQRLSQNQVGIWRFYTAAGKLALNNYVLAGLTCITCRQPRRSSSCNILWDSGRASWTSAGSRARAWRSWRAAATGATTASPGCGPPWPTGWRRRISNTPRWMTGATKLQSSRRKVNREKKFSSLLINAVIQNLPDINYVKNSC